MQQLAEQLKNLVHSNNTSAFHLKAYMVKLHAVQNAVGHLMERIDEIQYKGWDNDRGMAYLSIGEIEQTVRLIDMAFLPLTNEIGKTVGELNTTSDQIFELVIKEVNADELSEVTIG